MWPRDTETWDAVRYWIPVGLGILFCVYLGKLAVETSSPWFPIFCVSLGAAGLTFYSPKLGLGLLVFSMLLSPRLRGSTIGPLGAQGSALELRLDDILLAIVVCAWLARTAVLKRGAFLVATPIHLPIFLYTFLCVLSTAFAVMRGDLSPLRPLLFVVKYVEFFLLFFLSVNVVETREDARRFLGLGWMVAVIVTLYGYWQIPSGERVSTPFEMPVSLTASAIRGEIGNEANTYGGYCLVVFGALLGQYTQGSPGVSLFSILSFAFMLPPFLMTLSRSAYIGLIGAVLFLLVFSARKRLALAFGLSVVFLILSIVPEIREQVAGRVLYTFQGQQTGVGVRVSAGEFGRLNLEPSAGARVLSWRRILFEKFPKHPVLGAGVSGVGLVDTQIPRVLGEAGALGLLAFLWMMFRVWQVGWRMFSVGRDTFERSVGLSLLAALVGLGFHSLGANTFIIVRIVEPFWFLAALCARLDYNRLAEMGEAGA